MNTLYDSSSSLAAHLAAGAYQAYTYAYPHKSAYRALTPAPALDQLWATEKRSALFAYVHIPFCTMRCGFCNLFAMAQPSEALVDAYVAALVAQMRVMNEVLGERQFARLALGGGTPSYLSAAQLATLYEAAQQHLSIPLGQIPSGIEVSPETVTPERLAVCRQAGVSRVSMGIQSFVDAEVKALARPQQHRTVLQAVEWIRTSGIPTLNLDLIYGISGQTAASCVASVESALSLHPEEIYLYPLYVRPQTGLGRYHIRHESTTAPRQEDHRSALYAVARDRLRAAGYTQVSMRQFRAPHAPEDDGPVYCCQHDGMVGLGAGARSYTQGLHYASSYAVDRASTRRIIEDYIAQTPEQRRHAHHGFVLNADEQRRRYLIQSLLTLPGLDSTLYQQRFGSSLWTDWPLLQELLTLGLAECVPAGAEADAPPLLRLTAQGVAQSDIIGPWLMSPQVKALMVDTDHAGHAGHADTTLPLC